MNSLADIFGEPIHVYTRAQAIADGVLVNVSSQAREAGFTIHTVVTATLMGQLSEGCEEAQDHGVIAEYGRKPRDWYPALVKLALRVARKAVADTLKSGARTDLIEASVDFCGDRGLGRVPFLVHIGPGDQGEPVLTLMVEEDN